eukprot:comp5339_c0_seq1/m.1324 comp5339_c0_seq1/g.1324  ORF comp5339_c0_seq1/g.1324 comp5339_c0_seq1/m.1324 type:complete len:215 (-) comp5339_c0_seq1:502-1146(-)
MLMTESFSYSSSCQKENNLSSRSFCSLPTVDGTHALGMLEVDMSDSDDAFQYYSNMKAALGTENMNTLCNYDNSNYSSDDDESDPMDLSEFEDISVVSEQEATRYVLTRKPTRLDIIKNEEMYLAHSPLTYGEGFGTPAFAGSPQTLRHTCRHCKQSGPRGPLGKRHHYGCCFVEENESDHESELDECFNMPMLDSDVNIMDRSDTDEAVSITS